MDTLSEMAAGLEKPGEAALWKERARKMFSAMMERLYNPDGFVSRSLRTGEADGEAKSLINFLPLLIHYRMETSMKESLVRQLERFEGEYGLATERMDSLYYRKGGYWLGPVWAPVSLLFIDSLHSAGYPGSAARLAEKFRRLPSTGLMAENFDPQTGQGYDDNAFAWTAAVYLFLENYRLASIITPELSGNDTTNATAPDNIS
jgi:glycogen debranching enzyme